MQTNYYEILLTNNINFNDNAILSKENFKKIIQYLLSCQQYFIIKFNIELIKVFENYKNIITKTHRLNNKKINFILQVKDSKLTDEILDWIEINKIYVQVIFDNNLQNNLNQLVVIKQLLNRPSITFFLKTIIDNNTKSLSDIAKYISEKLFETEWELDLSPDVNLNEIEKITAICFEIITILKQYKFNLKNLTLFKININKYYNKNSFIITQDLKIYTNQSTQKLIDFDSLINVDSKYECESYRCVYCPVLNWCRSECVLNNDDLLTIDYLCKIKQDVFDFLLNEIYEQKSLKKQTSKKKCFYGMIINDFVQKTVCKQIKTPKFDIKEQNEK
jgi:hypothetical protein